MMALAKTRCRIYLDAPLAKGGHIVMPDTQAHYLRNVMRLKQGDAIGVFNGRDGEWYATLSMPSKKRVEASCSEQLRTQHTSPDITVCFAPVKGGRVETMIEKATELGARRIIPVKTTRTVAKHLNIERLSLVAREAAEQCERLDVPEILPLTPLGNILAEWPAQTPLFYGDESGRSMQHQLSAETPGAWGTLTGPEGGFTEEEFTMLSHVAAAKGLALGPRILRADTACITLLAITAQCWGDWEQLPHFQPPA